MSYITLTNDYVADVTVVSNRFIDEYMLGANEAQIKIYLYLLRCLNNGVRISVSTIADYFNYTEQDVVRALRHWDEQGVLSCSSTSNGNITSICLCDLSRWSKLEKSLEVCADNRHIDNEEKSVSGVTSSEVKIKKEEPVSNKSENDIKDVIKVVDFSNKKLYSAEEISKYMSNSSISQVFFVAETYLCKTLRPDEISSIIFMYEEYGFDADLIEYVFEYCADNKKTNIAYIETVAKNWALTGVTTAEEAKLRALRPSRESYEVLKAFGINGRSPVEPEISYVYKWTNMYGFGIDMIREACNRTIMQIHSASFEYADSILYNWKENNVTDFDGIRKLDLEHSRKKEFAGKKEEADLRKKKVAHSAAVNSSFNNFKQRDYDFDLLEKEVFSK